MISTFSTSQRLDSALSVTSFKWKKIALLVLLLGSATTGFAQTLKMNIDNILVEPASLAAGGCIQVPISFTNTDVNPQILEFFQFTVKLTDPDGVLASGVIGNYLVANGFVPSPGLGITDPASALTNVASGTPAPTCSVTFNPATQGGSSQPWPTGSASFVTVSNNQNNMGWKFAAVLEPLGLPLGQIEAGETYLIGVVVLQLNPIITPTQLTVEATSVIEDSMGNSYTLSNFGGGSFTELFDITEALGVVDIIGESIFLDGFESGL